MRSYPWGQCEALASQHSDILALRRLLFEEAWEALKARTEAQSLAYRATCLGFADRALLARRTPPPVAAIGCGKTLACLHQ